MDLKYHLDDWLAGEVSPEISKAMELAVVSDPAFAREVERRRLRWQSLRPLAIPAGAAADCTSAIVRRASWERQRRAPTFRWPLALAAGLIGAVLGVGAFAGASGQFATHESNQDQIAAWSEDGMPVKAGFASFSVEEPEGVADQTRPSLGVWTRPMELDLPQSAEHRGHLVVRVNEGSAAYQAGVRPGDVLLYIDDAPLLTPQCVAHALAHHQVGDRVQVTFFCSSGHCRKQRTVALGPKIL